MNVASLFSGIGGFDLGFERNGFSIVEQFEKDANCRELLFHAFPENFGGFENVLMIPALFKRKELLEKYRLLIEQLRAATVFCGGFPCQDLSVAGQRAGLAGERSGLWFAFRRIIALFRPPWVVIENVPGLLSSNGGRDLAVILSGLERIGYRWAYRTLDARYFGLAQRRERVFIIASLGNWGCAEVLFERESLCWDSAPSRETWKRVTGTLSARSEAGGGPGSDFEIGVGLSKTLKAQSNCKHREDSETYVAMALNAPGGGRRYDAESERTRADGRNFEAQEEVSYALTNPGSGGRTHSRQIATQSCVRRLTPTECERLQGFPDGWTEGFSDSVRYRMLGNAVAVPVAEWIAKRIKAQL